MTDPPSRRDSGGPPRELLDPEGEGIYLLDDSEKPRYEFPSVLMRAGMLLFEDGARAYPR